MLAAQRLAGLTRLVEGEGKQQALGGDELVTSLVGNLLGLIEDLSELLRQIDLAGAGAGNLRALGKDALDRRQLIEAYRVLTAGDFDEMRAVGSYEFYRLEIAADGRWLMFMAGE